MTIRHRTRGTPIDRRASTYNRTVDAILYAESQRENGVRRARNWWSYQGVIVKVKNVSGSSCDSRNILALPVDGSVIDPATIGDDAGKPWHGQQYNLDQFRYGETYLEGDTPSADNPTEPIAVLLQPADNNQIVEALVLGEVTCLVDIDDTNHRYACPQGSRQKMRSRQFGPARILHREDEGTGDDQWCKVLINYGSPLRFKAEVDGSAISAGGSGSVTMVNGTTKETTDSITAHYNFMTSGATSIADGTEVVVEWFPAELHWVITQADCP